MYLFISSIISSERKEDWHNSTKKQMLKEDRMYILSLIIYKGKVESTRPISTCPYTQTSHLHTTRSSFMKKINLKRMLFNEMNKYSTFNIKYYNLKLLNLEIF